MMPRTKQVTDLVRDSGIPEDPKQNITILNGSRIRNAVIRVGTSNWCSPGLTQNLYPPGTPLPKFLPVYSNYFNALQFDLTYYKNFNEADISKWKQEIENVEFRFCPTLFHRLLPGSKPVTSELEAAAIYKNLAAFGDRLGPVIIDLPENYSIRNASELEDFFTKLPTFPDYFVNLLHFSWYQKMHFQPLLKMLATHRIGLVINDLPQRPGILHSFLTIPKCFIRFTSGDNNETDKLRLTKWHQKIMAWKLKGLKEAYFIINAMPDNEFQLLNLMQELIK
jgi:uncharacterized protein YecE (DUF72 family)